MHEIRLGFGIIRYSQEVGNVQLFLKAFKQKLKDGLVTWIITSSKTLFFILDKVETICG